MTSSDADRQFMSRALALAPQGRGAVEPNPMVGCVIVSNGKVVGQGFHERFGGPHAEVEALGEAGDKAHGAVVYVTLEPCCHQGKTGPCTQALIDSQVARVVVGCEDPNPRVAGQGISSLRTAGIEVITGVLREEASSLIAPFAKLVTMGRPWVIAKWAMTLDGKIASHTRSSKWVSGAASRALVHELRGRVDAIVIGRGTAEADDPLLTARPPGPRTATRVVLDSSASLSSDCRLIASIPEAPLLVATTSAAKQENRLRLQRLGAEVFELAGDDRLTQMATLLDELGRRDMTNVLVEGGSEVLGSLLDLGAIDEVYAFIAPKLLGGTTALTPIAGKGITAMQDAISLDTITLEKLGDDLYLHARVARR